MIIEAILNLISSVILIIVQGIPQTTLSIPDGIFDGLNSITHGIGYVVPLGKLLPIFVISFGLSAFRLALAIIDRIKSFIPTLGGV